MYFATRCLPIACSYKTSVSLEKTWYSARLHRAFKSFTEHKNTTFLHFILLHLFQQQWLHYMYFIRSLLQRFLLRCRTIIFQSTITKYIKAMMWSILPSGWFPFWFSEVNPEKQDHRIQKFGGSISFLFLS